MSKPQWMSMADPIHGVIRLRRHEENHQLILDVMNSQAFQRLRRIRQMGMAEFVFPGATHSRFVHSIGATWLMLKALDHLKEYESFRELLQSPFEDTGISHERLLILSILVHDIGHTPLSHTLEDILDLKSQDLLHDTYWNQMILEQDTELTALWEHYGARMPEALARFNGLTPGSQRHFLADLVSSQLDMDRLDYLLRDSHYLGVQYGRIEVDRILTSLFIGHTPTGELAVAVRQEAIPAVEHYLFGRYEAYKMALHSLDKASETLLKKTLERFRWVRENTSLDPGHPADLIYKLMQDGRSISMDEYLMFDDCYLWDKINLWARFSKDELLKQLSLRLLRHDLFKYVEINQYTLDFSEATLTPIVTAMQDYYQHQGLSFEYGFDQMIVTPKMLYQPANVKPPIWVRQQADKLVDFSELSALPLHQEIEHGQRCLMFVWDRQAKQFLKDLLSRSFSIPLAQSNP